MTAATSNRELGDKMDALAANMTEVVTILEIVKRKVDRLDEAMYGNGSPGLKEQVRALDKRVATVEQGDTQAIRELAKQVEVANAAHGTCQIGQVKECLDTIRQRHDEEDRRAANTNAIAQRTEEELKAERAEARKTKYAILAALATAIIGLIINLINTVIVH